MKKRHNLLKKLIVLFLIIIVPNSFDILATNGAVTTIDSESWGEMSIEERTSVANNPDYQLSKDQIQQVDVKDMTPDTVSKYMDDLSSEQKKQLKAQQLTHSNNLQKTGDLSELDNSALKQSMKEKFNVEIPDVDSGTNLEMQNGNLKSLNINFKNDNSQLIIPNPLTTNNKDTLIKINGNSNSKISYTISDSSIKLDLENIDKVSIGNQEKNIIDFEINDTSKPAKIEIKKQPDDSLFIITENINSIFYGDEFIEIIRGESSEYFVDLEHGFFDIILDSPGIYRFRFKDLPEYYNGGLVRSDKSFAQSYAIHRDFGLSRYKLILDKQNHRLSLETFKSLNKNNFNAGYVSLIEHKVYLKGVVNYLRLGFEIRGLLSSGGSVFFAIIETDNSFHKIYEGKNQPPTAKAVGMTER